MSGSHFYKDGSRVFLSGTNLAWVHYGYDFGNNQYSGVRTQMERYLSEIHASGGNSIRKKTLKTQLSFLKYFQHRMKGQIGYTF